MGLAVAREVRGRDVTVNAVAPGPTATADYPTVLLSGNWLSQEQVSAASEFARFMRKPEHLSELAKAEGGVTCCCVWVQSPKRQRGDHEDPR